MDNCKKKGRKAKSFSSNSMSCWKPCKRKSKNWKPISRRKKCSRLSSIIYKWKKTMYNISKAMMLLFSLRIILKKAMSLYQLLCRLAEGLF